MFAPSSLWLAGWLLALTATAAVTDLRARVIPNWLTLSTLIAAGCVHAVRDGGAALGSALAAAAICSLAPLVLFGLRAMGGGDVKLFAAIGALAGVRLGLELQFAGYTLALLYGLAALARRRRVRSTLLRAWSILRAPLLRHDPALRPEPENEICLGPAVFCASALVLYAHASGFGR